MRAVDREREVSDLEVELHDDVAPGRRHEAHVDGPHGLHPPGARAFLAVLRLLGRRGTVAVGGQRQEGEGDGQLLTTQQRQLQSHKSR